MNTYNHININPKRQSDYLPIVKYDKLPKRFLFFDTETNQTEISQTISEHKLILGVAVYIELNAILDVYKREEYIFYSTDEFINILKKYDHKKKKLHIFAHNIKFDLMVLDLPFKLMMLGYPNRYPIVNGMAFIWNCKLDNGNFIFLDTANYAGVALSKIGEDLGIPKMDIDFDNTTDEYLIEYCKNDVAICEIFIISMLKFLRSNKLGGFRVTLASLAFNVFRYRFMNIKPFVTLRPDILDLERKAYYGGRTETFWIGKIPEDEIYYVDINSAYPFAMTKPVPIEPVFAPRENPTFSGLLFNMENNYIIADVTLNTKLNAFPIRHNDRLCFPIGEFRTVLHQCELEFAIEHDLIDSVHTYQAYRQAVLFDEYVDFFYNEKVNAGKQGNSTNRMIAKLFLNSLYGKFGQIWKHTERVGDNKNLECYILNNRDLNGGREWNEICWYGVVYKNWSDGEDKYSIPSISGAITAYGRMLLYEYMTICGFDNVYYCDTDSIMTNKQGYDNLSNFIDKTKLGYLALEDTSNHVYLHGAKDYEFNSNRKIKGVPKTAIEVLPDYFQFIRFEGFKEWRNRGGKGAPRMIDTSRQRRNPYTKGFHNGRGLVKPLVFIDNEDKTNDFYSQVLKEFSV